MVFHFDGENVSLIIWLMILLVLLIRLLVLFLYSGSTQRNLRFLTWRDCVFDHSMHLISSLRGFSSTLISSPSFLIPEASVASVSQWDSSSSTWSASLFVRIFLLFLCLDIATLQVLFDIFVFLPKSDISKKLLISLV